MGFVLAMGSCVNCDRVFSFNPHKVPSVRLNGVRQPVCKECIEYVNPLRAAKGQPMFHVEPDAYEAIDESEL